MARYFIWPSIAVALALAGCAEPPGNPESAGYFPPYEMGIDQDISATHGVGQPLGDNLRANGVDTWQVGGPQNSLTR